jgi:2-isopropylmalate synthase
VTVRLDDNGLTAQGQGADTDTLVAAAMAYVQAWNKLVLKRGRVL